MGPEPALGGPEAKSLSTTVLLYFDCLPHVVSSQHIFSVVNQMNNFLGIICT